MAVIELETRINAPAIVCFDLSRSIDMHMESMQKSNEKAIAGITSGLIELGQTVTWQARHFGINMRMTIKITEMQYPDQFTDEMVKGPFRSLKHTHRFLQKDNHCLMTDTFIFRSPMGLLGKLVDLLFMKAYMTKLLEERNATIKKAAEDNN